MYTRLLALIFIFMAFSRPLPPPLPLLHLFSTFNPPLITSSLQCNGATIQRRRSSSTLISAISRIPSHDSSWTLLARETKSFGSRPSWCVRVFIEPHVHKQSNDLHISQIKFSFHRCVEHTWSAKDSVPPNAATRILSSPISTRHTRTIMLVSHLSSMYERAPHHCFSSSKRVPFSL
jgi:hypothetical protein